MGLKAKDFEWETYQGDTQGIYGDLEWEINISGRVEGDLKWGVPSTNVRSWVVQDSNSEVVASGQTEGLSASKKTAVEALNNYVSNRQGSKAEDRTRVGVMRELEVRDRLARLEDLLRESLQEVVALKAETEQSILEEGAVVVNYGDPEPDVPAGGRMFQSSTSVVWYRTLLDGWRWDGRDGECLFGTGWESIPERYFPMQELVGIQLKGTKGWRRAQ